MSAQTRGFDRFGRWLGELRSKVGGTAAIAIEVVTVLLAALAAGAVAFLLGMTTPVRFVEALTLDLRMTLTAPPAATPLVIIKMDDTAMAAMRDASPCRCLSPVDKAWLADLITALDRKGVRAVGLDYLIDNWRDPEELARFRKMVSGLRSPLTAVVDPSLRGGIDYDTVPGLRYADARTLISDDYDGVVRRYDPAPGRLRSLAGEIAASVGGRPAGSPFVMRYRAPDPAVSAENAGAIAPSYSAAYVAALPDSFFKGRIALIGRTTRAAGPDADTPAEDMHLTPLRFLPGNSAGTPGVEVHAHALSQMLEGDRLTVMDPAGALLLIAAAALIGALLGRAVLTWWVSSVLILIGAAAMASLALILFARFGVIVPIAAPALAFMFAFFLLSRLVGVQLREQRAFYATALERYLSPSVIERIVDGSEPLRIGAEAREITVLISDLENFSDLVAETPVDQFSQVMNDYLGELTEILWRHEALIDKMTGDGVVAIFGAPIAQPDHAARALTCAAEIDEFAERFRLAAVARGLNVGRTRMGVNSGTGLVGNFGGRRRFNYTAYGQVVVIAARLEAANKGFDTRILFSEATMALARPVSARLIGDVDLKGVSEPIRAYTPG